MEAVQGWFSVADVSDFRQFELSGPSAEVWSRIDGYASDDEVVRAVLARYPEHPDTAYGECLALIERLSGLGLIVVQSDADDRERDERRRDHRGHAVNPAQKGTVE